MKDKIFEHIEYLNIFTDLNTLNIQISSQPIKLLTLRCILEGSEIPGVARSPATDGLFDIRYKPAMTDDRRAKFHSMVAKILYSAKRSSLSVLQLCRSVLQKL